MHCYYTAMSYPEVPMDWVTLSEEITCTLTMISGNAFPENNAVERLEKTPALQFYGKLRTREQQRTMMENRYKSRTLENIFQ